MTSIWLPPHYDAERIERERRRKWFLELLLAFAIGATLAGLAAWQIAEGIR